MNRYQKGGKNSIFNPAVSLTEQDFFLLIFPLYGTVASQADWSVPCILHKLRYIVHSLKIQGVCKYNEYRTE